MKTETIPRMTRGQVAKHLPELKDIGVYTDKQIAAVMNKCQGNVDAAAIILCVNAKHLEKRISKSPKLAIAFDVNLNISDLPDAIEPDHSPPPAELYGDDPVALAEGNARLANDVLKMDMSILTDALERAGVDAVAVGAINSIASMDADVGKSFGLSIKWSTANAVLMQTQLVEMLTEIRRTYLNPNSESFERDPDRRIEYMRLVATLTDSSMKAGDRVYTGGQILIKLMSTISKSKGRGDSKGKPGFSPRMKTT